MGAFDGPGQWSDPGNGQWPPNQSGIAQIFQGMLGANQGIPNMLMANQMAGYNQFGNQMQRGSEQTAATNAGNQQAALGVQGLQANLTGQRMGDVTALDRAMLQRPMQAGLLSVLQGALSGVGGMGGRLGGIASTNSPQSAALPGFGGNAPIGSTTGQPQQPWMQSAPVGQLPQQPLGTGQQQGGSLFDKIMNANPWGPIQQANAMPGATQFNPFNALAQPADEIRRQQNINANAALHRTPTSWANIVPIGMGG